MSIAVLVITVLTGLVAGLISGLMGVGGGTILIPAMVLFLAVPQHMAHGVSLAVMVPTAMIGAYGYYLKKNVDLDTALFLVAGAIPGSLLGVQLACAIPSADLKKIFGIFVIIIAIRVAYDAFSNKG